MTAPRSCGYCGERLVPGTLCCDKRIRLIIRRRLARLNQFEQQAQRKESLIVTIDYAPELGKRFVTVLEEWLTPEEFETVRTRNDAREPGICHSHDFCDANMAMEQAWRDVLKRWPDPSWIDGDSKLWHRAWDWAIDHYLSHSPTAMALQAGGFPEVTAEPTVDLNDRDSLIAWHVWNDRNGCYRDADVAAEGAGLGYWTIEDLRSLYLTGAVAPTV